MKTMKQELVNYQMKFVNLTYEQTWIEFEFVFGHDVWTTFYHELFTVRMNKNLPWENLTFLEMSDYNFFGLIKMVSW